MGLIAGVRAPRTSCRQRAEARAGHGQAQGKPFGTRATGRPSVTADRRRIGGGFLPSRYASSGHCPRDLGGDVHGQRPRGPQSPHGGVDGLADDRLGGCSLTLNRIRPRRARGSRVGLAQADRERAGERLEELHAQPRVLLGERVEALAREDEELGRRERHRVRRAHAAVEERHVAEEVAAAEGGQVELAAVAQAQRDAHAPAPDEEDLVAGVALRGRSAPPRAQPRSTTQASRCRSVSSLAPLEEVDLAQAERRLLRAALPAFLLQEAVLGPLQRVRELVEAARRAAPARRGRPRRSSRAGPARWAGPSGRC